MANGDRLERLFEAKKHFLDALKAPAKIKTDESTAGSTEALHLDILAVQIEVVKLFDQAVRMAADDAKGQEIAQLTKLTLFTAADRKELLEKMLCFCKTDSALELAGKTFKLFPDIDAVQSYTEVVVKLAQRKDTKRIDDIIKVENARQLHVCLVLRSTA